MFTMYGLKNCSTCQKAQAWFKQHGLPLEFVDYRDHPLDPARLPGWAQDLGGWPKLVNRASMTWRQLPDDRKDPQSDAQWLALISEFPALVRRPLLLSPQGEVSVGFNEGKFAARFL